MATEKRIKRKTVLATVLEGEVFGMRLANTNTHKRERVCVSRCVLAAGGDKERAWAGGSHAKHPERAMKAEY